MILFNYWQVTFIVGLFIGFIIILLLMVEL